MNEEKRKNVEAILLDPKKSELVVVYRTIKDEFLKEEEEVFVGVMTRGMYEVAVKYNAGQIGKQELGIQMEGTVYHEGLRCKSQEEYTQSDIDEINKYTRKLSNLRRKVSKNNGDVYEGKITLPIYAKSGIYYNQEGLSKSESSIKIGCTPKVLADAGILLDTYGWTAGYENPFETKESISLRSIARVIKNRFQNQER